MENNTSVDDICNSKHRTPKNSNYIKIGYRRHEVLVITVEVMNSWKHRAELHGYYCMIAAEVASSSKHNAESSRHFNLFSGAVERR